MLAGLWSVVAAMAAGTLNGLHRSTMTCPLLDVVSRSPLGLLGDQERAGEPKQDHVTIDELRATYLVCRW